LKWYALYLFVSLPLGTVIFFGAMFLSSVMLGAIEIGELHVALFKAFFLLVLVNVVALVPFGNYFTWLVWLVGLMVIFRLDLWEARVLFVINWLMNMALKFALVMIFLHWAMSGGLHDDDDHFDHGGRQVRPLPGGGFRPAPDMDPGPDPDPDN